MTTMPPDQAARDRIRTDLATNLLVEAGAGSGKTTSLVERMLEHVRTGTPVERLAAVTFTRKAANELRERFQVRLERAAREAVTGSDEQARYAQALVDLDRAFLGTIHSFCGRLLRERPLEAGLSPDFQEVTDEGWAELRDGFWRRWVERMKRQSDADFRALATVGLEPHQLGQAFATVLAYPDVEFPLGDVALPDAAPCRRALERLLVEARQLMPVTAPPNGWDALMQLVRRLEFRRAVSDWDDVAQLCAAVERISQAACKVTQERWAGRPRGRSPEAKALGEAWLAFLEQEVADLLRCWREYRYPVVMRVLQRAARDFADERHATGQLNFEDLLLLTARLLRERPVVRAELGARYAHLLVDEFQDTDPVQAEVCLLLASDPAEGTDWRTVTPRPGSLFVVGDPKQSIYRFRRADIQVYEFVKQRIRACGDELALTSNFRSVRSIEEVVNAHFAAAFPEAATAEQAAYRPMQTVHEPASGDGVCTYLVSAGGTDKDAEVLRADAELVASWIAERIGTGERAAGDFLILTARKKPIAQYARALAARNIPVSTTGAALPQEHELRELLVVLRALADPENAVQVAAALEGLFFGLSPADLWDGKLAGLRFAVTHPPSSEDGSVGRALRQMHEWWKYAQRHAADVLLERLLDDTGLLVHAASADLGEARAGALLHLVGAARRAALEGALALGDAMAHLESVLAADEVPDAPLRPGRTDAVRVMNLHKAKGLEAEVVILAAPLDEGEKEPRVHVARDRKGSPVGGLVISHQEGNQVTMLAQPPGWAELRAVESRFIEAERARLLYVAATRARRELVVAQRVTAFKTKAPEPDASMWRPLAPSLARYARALALEVRVPEGRERMVTTGAELRTAAALAGQRVEAAAAASFTVRTVTESAKERPAVSAGSPGGAGAAWGRAVHRAVEALGRGRRGASLDAFVRAVARDESLSDEEAARLTRVLAEFVESPTWRELLARGVLQVELAVMQRTTSDDGARVLEGVIDAAVLGDDGWHVVDWKTDMVADDVWVTRRVQYERQVGAYTGMLQSLTGRPASAEVVRVLMGVIK